MQNIKLSSGYQLVPTGTHIFQITGVEYNEDTGVMKIKMKTKDGCMHTERFSLLKKKGVPNEGALNAFSYFARTALRDSSVSDINPEELIGFFIECDVEHEAVPSKKEEGKTTTFVRLTDKRPATGFEGDEAPAPSASSSGGFDLDDLLG